MVICLERDAELYMAQLMPLPLTVSCFRKIQSGFTFLVPAHLGSPGKGPLNGCVSVVIKDTVLVSVWHNKGMHSVECRLVITDSIVKLRLVHSRRVQPCKNG